MLNRTLIMGRLTRDPELKYTQTQTPVVSFAVAVDRDFVKPGEQREADFLNVVAWRGTAEFISKWFHKGSMIVVDGRVQTRKWEDKFQQKRTEVEIVAENVYFGESRATAAVAEHIAGHMDAQAPVAAAVPPPSHSADQSRFDFRNDFRPVDDDDDVPF